MPKLIQASTINNLADAVNAEFGASSGPESLSASIIAALIPKLDSTSYTAADAFTKLKTVDGPSSGIDLDLFRGAANSNFLLYKSTLGTTENLNDLITAGMWHQPYTADAATARNYPVADAGMLTVKQFGTGYVYQEYQVYDSSRTYQRTKYSTTWFPWKRIIDSNVPKFSAHGLGPAAGPIDMKLPNTRFNSGNMYDPATGKITIQQAGIYKVHYSGLQQPTAHMYLMKNGVGITYSYNNSTAYVMSILSYFGPMAVGDTMHVWIPSGYPGYNAGDANSSYHRFWGQFLG